MLHDTNFKNNERFSFYYVFHLVNKNKVTRAV